MVVSTDEKPHWDENGQPVPADAPNAHTFRYVWKDNGAKTLDGKPLQTLSCEGDVDAACQHFTHLLNAPKDTP